MHVYTTLALDQLIKFYRVVLTWSSIALYCNKHTLLGGIHHLVVKNSLYTTCFYLESLYFLCQLADTIIVDSCFISHRFPNMNF